MAHYTFGDGRPGSPATLVAVIDATICGFVATGPARDEDAADAGEVYAIYVDPQAWGRGIGRSLIAEARTRLSRQGFTEAVLWVHAGNERAQRFYRPTDGSPTGTGVKNTCGARWPTKSVIAAVCLNADRTGFSLPRMYPHMPLIGKTTGTPRGMQNRSSQVSFFLLPAKMPSSANTKVSTPSMVRAVSDTAVRKAAGCVTDNHEDMHGGEVETSILLAEFPEVVGPDYESADFVASDRRHLLTMRIQAYSPSGILGRPSLATAEKGRTLLAEFSRHFKECLNLLR